MTVKDIFRIVIKVLALFVFINGIVISLPSIFLYFKSDISFALILTGAILLLLALIYFMLLNTDSIINRFKLSKGFDTEKFDFSKADSKYIFELAIIIIGLNISISSLPTILFEGFLFFKHKVSSNSTGMYFNLNEEYTFYNNLMYLIVGILIIISRKQIIKMFN